MKKLNTKEQQNKLEDLFHEYINFNYRENLTIKQLITGFYEFVKETKQF